LVPPRACARGQFFGGWDPGVARIGARHSGAPEIGRACGLSRRKILSPIVVHLALAGSLGAQRHSSPSAQTRSTGFRGENSPLRERGRRGPRSGVLGHVTAGRRATGRSQCHPRPIGLCIPPASTCATWCAHTVETRGGWTSKCLNWPRAQARG